MAKQKHKREAPSQCRSGDTSQASDEVLANTPPFSELEVAFFAAGDAGICEPPVFLPTQPWFVPAAGAVLLVLLSIAVLA